jgi:CheY-like chemotaxis protein
MTTAAPRRSALLRVEWGASGVHESTTAIEVTETSAFVMTESLPPVGAEVDLLLRFASRPTIHVRGIVRQVRLSLEPGVPAGFCADFVGDPSELAKLAVLASDAPHAPRRTSRTLHVLHVERQLLLRDMFAYALKRYFGSRGLGIELAQAAGLAGARGAIEGERLDAIIVDFDANDVTGDEIARYARAHAPAACWIVGVGGDATRNRDRMLEAGADVYLRKPLVLRDLFYSMELLSLEDPDDGVGLGAA